jgi:hypothetical protein
MIQVGDEKNTYRIDQDYVESKDIIILAGKQTYSVDL